MSDMSPDDNASKIMREVSCILVGAKVAVKYMGSEIF